mmetsp:Transcript_29075/g.53509  ORF Transcript_29075/g.53509 Transcript_29075/m.53509 type:complete len:233 (-) Transcript_29075:584-1282(-)
MSNREQPPAPKAGQAFHCHDHGRCTREAAHAGARLQQACEAHDAVSQTPHGHIPTATHWSRSLHSNSLLLAVVHHVPQRDTFLRRCLLRSQLQYTNRGRDPGSQNEAGRRKPHFCRPWVRLRCHHRNKCKLHADLILSTPVQASSGGPINYKSVPNPGVPRHCRVFLQGGQLLQTGTACSTHLSTIGRERLGDPSLFGFRLARRAARQRDDQFEPALNLFHGFACEALVPPR